MKYYENGFYLEQNADKTRYEITDEYWQELMDLQSQGKEITTGENGKPVAVDHISTPQELAETELLELTQWFDNEYSYKEQKYNRLIALEKLTDDGKDPAQVLKELYLLAEENRKAIQQLEKEIKGDK